MLPMLGALVVALSMATTVRRGAQARLLSREVEALGRAEEVTRTQLRQTLARVDSLSSRGRILRAASELGLRPATDREIVFLVDVDPLPAGEKRAETAGLSRPTRAEVARGLP